MNEKLSLNRTDYEIISLLRNNARLSNKELAANIGLAPSSCLERVKNLQQRGLFKGFHAEVDIAKLGIGLQAMVAIRLTQHSRLIVESFRQHLLTQPQVQVGYHLSGANDFMVHVCVENADQLRDFVLSAFAERPEVAHIETAVIYEQTHNWLLPIAMPE